jgi:O-antigen/teichoic acid export membrane protein
MSEVSSVRRSRGGDRAAARQLQWQTPVLRGALALTLNSAASAALGLLFWTLAARMLPVEQVGLGVATVATITTVSNLGQLNLYLTAGVLLSGSRRPRRLVLELSGLATAATLIVGTGAAVLWGVTGVGGELVTGGPLFVLCAVGWTLFALKDGLLVGLRGFAAVPALNTLYGVLKIGTLALMAASLDGGSLVAATFAPVLVILPLAAWLMFRRTQGLESAATSSSGLDRRFIGVDFVGSVCKQISTTLLPFLILVWSGAHAAGIFAVVWLLVVMLDTLAENGGVPLASEAARDPHRTRHLAGMISKRAFALVLAVVAATLVFADMGLGFYGDAYAEDGAFALRIMALASLARCYTILTLALVRAERRAATASTIEAVHLLALFGAAALLVPVHGVTGMALAWFVAQLVTMAACWLARPRGGR